MMAARSSGPRFEAMAPITVTPVWNRNTSLVLTNADRLRAGRQKSEPIESAAGKYIFLRMTDNPSNDFLRVILEVSVHIYSTVQFAQLDCTFKPLGSGSIAPWEDL